MIYCEVLKIDTNEIWAFDFMVQIGDSVWQQLQDSTNPVELGCIFIRNFNYDY